MKDEELSQAARILLDWIKELSPEWRLKLEAMEQERGFDARQMLGSLIGYTLDTGQHMTVPAHDFFQQGFAAAGKVSICPVCGSHYQLLYPGQPLCSAKCADDFRRLDAEGQEDLLIARDALLSHTLPPQKVDSGTVEKRRGRPPLVRV